MKKPNMSRILLAVATLALTVVVPATGATALAPVDRANALLAQMTTAEKITMMHGGAQCAWGACVDANTRLGIPALKLQDGPAGVADGAGGVTQLPAPVAGAASFDSALMGQYGQVVGSEEWGKGANTRARPDHQHRA
jgi:beta-glucosidase